MAGRAAAMAGAVVAGWMCTNMLTTAPPPSAVQAYSKAASASEGARPTRRRSLHPVLETVWHVGYGLDFS